MGVSLLSSTETAISTPDPDQVLTATLTCDHRTVDGAVGGTAHVRMGG